MAQLNFAVADVPMSDTGGKDFSPIPEGTYKAVIFESEMKQTKTGGKMLVLTWEIKEGPHTGRRIWDRLNVVNKNPKAENIAKKDLAAICMSMGLDGCTDSEQLHWKDVDIKVVVRPPENGYDASNEIKGYAAPAGAATPPPAAPAGPPAYAEPPRSMAEAVATASDKKPWD